MYDAPFLYPKFGIFTPESALKQSVFKHHQGTQGKD